jgi:ATP-binding cassette subfamily B protein
MGRSGLRDNRPRFQSLALMNRLLQVLSKQQRLQLLVLAPVSVLVAAMDLGLVVLIARLVGVLGLGGGKPVHHLVLAVIGLAWAVSLLKGGLRLWQYQLGGQIWRQLSTGLLKRLLLQPYAFHLNRARVELSTRLLKQLEQLSHQAVLPAVLVIGSAATVLLLVVGLLWLAGPLALLLMLMVVGLYGLLGLLLQQPLRKLQEQRMQAEVAATTQVLDALAAIRSVLMEGTQQVVLQRFERLTRRIERSMALGEALPQLPRLVVEPVGLTSVLLLLLVPQIRSSGDSSLPWLALVTVTMLRLAQPLQELSRAFIQLQGSVPLLRECMALLELPCPAMDRGGATERSQAWQTLALEDLHVRYPGQKNWVLEGLDLRVGAGERLALVGASGSGKTTLASVLLGLITPQRGDLHLDGAPLKGQALTAWQRRCAEVGQPVSLLHGSLAENLWCWQAPQEESQLWAVLEQVGLAPFVRSLPRGLHTDVGDNGLCLSGGQRQRLAMARALLLHPTLLVLDEATSGLDQAGESALLAQLDRLSASTTVVVIAHREATMRRCNRVALLDGGKIVDQAPFPVLEQRCRRFRELLALEQAQGLEGISAAAERR